MKKGLRHISGIYKMPEFLLVGRIDLMKKGLRQPALLDEGGGGLKNFKPGSLQWNQKEVKSRISLPGCSSSLDIKWAVKF